MIRRVYACRGFDCANCATNAERHLNKHPKVASARIDMMSERLYIQFDQEELNAEEILAVIHEVEEDEVELAPLGEKKKEGMPKSTWILIARIAYCVLTFLVCGFFFKDFYWVRFSLYLIALAAIEYDLLAKVVKNIIHKQNPLDEYLLVSVASIGAFVLAALKYGETGEAVAFGSSVFMVEEHFEAILVCLLWQVGELFQDLAVDHARASVQRAVERRVEEALLITEQGVISVQAQTLRPGDKVMVNAGRLIPIDGIVERGSGYCDASSLTGESLPISLQEGSEVHAGTLLTEGEVVVVASKDYASSSAAKILDLVTGSLERKGQAEKFITRFARIYTPAIFGVAVIYILLAGFFGPSWRSAVYTGLEIMVISCPCALVISVPLAYFASIGLASKNGIVIKGASYLDALTDVKVVCTDKTGTLTEGRFEVTSMHVSPKIDESEFKKTFVSLECLSAHPLAKAIVEFFAKEERVAVEHFEIVPGKGVAGLLGQKKVFAGDREWLLEQGLSVPEDSVDTKRIHLAVGKTYYGYLELEDKIKANAPVFVKALRRREIDVCMLSGDDQNHVAKVCDSLGITEYYAGLLPDEKLHILEEKTSNLRGNVVYLGDGINDAPCLARADVGVAMGGLGADLAIEEADVLLLDDDPLRFLTALKVAKKSRNVILFNIVFAIAVKVAVLVLAMIFKESMPMEVAVLADTGVSVLLTFNSLLLLTRRL